jgi:hypothetical protein
MAPRETRLSTAMTPAHSSSGDPANPRGIDHALRLRSLWIAYLLAMLFHVQLGLMPLFHGLSVVIGTTVNPSRLTMVYWSMMVYFLLPLAALLLISWAASDGRGDGPWRPWRRWHFWLSVVYSVTNLFHLIADVIVPDSRGDQVFLMAILLVIGLLINRQAWLWWHPGSAAMQT